MIVVGMQSGTSVDGLDMAVADLHLRAGGVTMRILGDLTVPWSDRLRGRVLAALPPAATTVAEICALDTQIGRETAGVARRAIGEIAGGTADLVASLGQTVFHWIEGDEALGTLQLGQPAWIVEQTGLPVISDLRARDIAAGGHGAPLASTLDALWLRGERPMAALNIDGIANITVVDATAAVTAFDTGPGNCLIDVLAARISGGARTPGTLRFSCPPRAPRHQPPPRPSVSLCGKSRTASREVSDGRGESGPSGSFPAS